MRCVPNMNVLNKIPNKPELGEKVLIEDEKKVYEYTEEGWAPVKEAETGITLYDLNKIACAKLPPLDSVGLSKAKEDINKYINLTGHTYYILLCKDLSYYTVFVVDQKSNEKIEDVIIECLQYLGDIVNINIDEDVIESWFVKDGEAFVSYLCAYDGGVIACQK